MKRESQRMFSQKRLDENGTLKNIKSNKSIQFKKTKTVYSYDLDGKKKKEQLNCCNLI
jgi:hypothetical protein